MQKLSTFKLLSARLTFMTSLLGGYFKPPFLLKFTRTVGLWE